MLFVIEVKLRNGDFFDKFASFVIALPRGIVSGVQLDCHIDFVTQFALTLSFDLVAVWIELIELQLAVEFAFFVLASP